MRRPQWQRRHDPGRNHRPGGGSALVCRTDAAVCGTETAAEQGAIALLERSAVIAALRTLPARQREALVLRYYADLSEAQIASTMGISRGAVKSHMARATAALRCILERDS
jgi:RNA polymerase sigma factor (sigma-70 family)